MSNMKCPFCQQELDAGGYYVHCHNPHCNTTVEMEGTEEMWEVLIRTRKALDVALDALKKIGFGCGIPPDENYAYNYINIAADAHQQITALEAEK